MPSSEAKGFRCQVIDAAKLPADAGTETSLCAAIETAMKAAAPGIDASVTVRILSNSALSATVRTGGRVLPEQKMAVSDRSLNRVSIDRFAQAIALQLAGEGGR